jgi:hypothetical protein
MTSTFSLRRITKNLKKHLRNKLCDSKSKSFTQVLYLTTELLKPSKEITPQKRYQKQVSLLDLLEKIEKNKTKNFFKKWKFTTKMGHHPAWQTRWQTSRQ